MQLKYLSDSEYNHTNKSLCLTTSIALWCPVSICHNELLHCAPPLGFPYLILYLSRVGLGSAVSRQEEENDLMDELVNE